MKSIKTFGALMVTGSAMASPWGLRLGARCLQCQARQSTAWLPPSRSISHGAGIRGRHVMATASINVFFSNRFAEHRMGGFHPEQPTRVSTAARLLQTVQGVSIVSPSAERDPAAFDKALAAIRRVHDPGYVEEIKQLCESGGGEIDSDTYASPKTYEVCVIAASAWLDAVDSTLTNGRPSFALTRPPGHHALADQAMGFCIFNFAVIAARYALDVLGLRRVAILDWDVHHGNGIADLVQNDARIRYCSLHQEGSFPLTGGADDQGPIKNLLHIPLPAYTDMRGYLPLYRDQALPFLKTFEPDLVIVSAGYDTLTEDNLAQLCMNPVDYRELSSLLIQTFGPSRLVFGLEGGYEPSETAEAIKATIEPLVASA